MFHSTFQVKNSSFNQGIVKYYSLTIWEMTIYNF